MCGEERGGGGCGAPPQPLGVLHTHSDQLFSSV